MAKTNTITAPTTSPSASPLWRIVLSEYQAASAAYDAFGPTYRAACKALEAVEGRKGFTDEYQAAEREQDALADVLFAARNKMFLTPAPDSEALAFKMRTLCAYLKECDAEDTERVEALAADVRSLFGVAA